MKLFKKCFFVAALLACAFFGISSFAEDQEPYIAEEFPAEAWYAVWMAAA
jgi:hypothetical protein